MGSKRSSALDFSDGNYALDQHPDVLTYYAGDTLPTHLQRNKTERRRLQGLQRSNTAVSTRSGPPKRATFREKFGVWMINEGGRQLFFGVWIFLHLLVAIFGFINYQLKDNMNDARHLFGVTYVIARTAALVLHVDVIFILLPVCRNFVSLLRRTPLNDFIPFDKNITFHKATAWSIVVWTVVHIIAHMVNFAKLAMTDTQASGGKKFLNFLAANFTTGPGATGWIMTACLAVMVFFAMEKRRRAHFERFWYSHHLFIPFFVCWQLHGMFCMIKPDRPPFCSFNTIGVFWRYWLIGGVIYVFERILREIRSRHRTYISKVIQHPSNVMELQIKKEKITTRAGQYIFLSCPEVSYFQWHPFTLTSAPEEDYVSVHIRVVGDFTRALAHAVGCNFENRENGGDAAGSKVVGTVAKPPLNRTLPRVMIDGPFGSASEDFFKFETVLLVGAGIGVTPFASILKSIWYRMNRFNNSKPTRLSKVYFTWVIRDFGTAEWFHSLLHAIEEQDTQSRIEINIYLTAKIKEDDMNNIFVQDVGADKDAITSLRAPTHFGRPNWDRVFTSITEKHPETDVGVFFCGPSALSKTLHQMSNKYSQHKSTRFFFGKDPPDQYKAGYKRGRLPASPPKCMLSSTLCPYIHRKSLRTLFRPCNWSYRINPSLLAPAIRPSAGIMAQRRLKHILQELTPLPESVGTLKLGDITYEVPVALTPSRLPRSKDLLDINEAVNRDNLHFLLQKHLLGQDVFLVSQPGPYARRLALTFASLINAEYEYIALHRDVGETELKQGREIRKGGNLIYVDSPAVSAVKHGRLLILEGIEKAERGIMPVLNNLLENREMNLDDGTHIIHPQRYAQLEATNSISVGGGHNFVPAHKNFRVIAIAAPVPPYPGYPLDPPFRSRFQSRFVDPVGSLTALRVAALQNTPPSSLYTKLRDLILSTQFASESRNALEAISRSSLPPFPQTAIAKLSNLIAAFPPPAAGLTPSQLARLLLTIHPSLVYSSFQAWALLSRQTEEAGLGALGTPSMSQDEDIGLMGYRISAIKRLDEMSAEVTFAHSGAPPVVLRVPAGTKTLRPFPFAGDLEFHPTKRFLGLLTCFMQAHALGWDISLIPPAIPSTASTSTSTLVKVFGQVLGYEQEVIHMYKELGGRELVMRRKIQDGGATTWEPSPLIEGVWAGQLVHLSGLDVIGSTAGSVARLIQDREIELWENKRIVSEASPEELAKGELSLAHPSFRIISTASKSLPLKDWLLDEHANMFFPIPSQPMSHEEELEILRATNCSQPIVESLLSFAEKYRQSISDDNVLKNRRLGTRSLVRIARRLARFPQDDDLNAIISRSLLAEFLPAVEKINLDTLLVEAKIEPKPPLFNANPVVEGKTLIFSATKPSADDTFQVSIPMFKPSQDVDGVASHVPHMDHFYDNSLQSGLMRDLAIDMELLGEHVVLLGNQGVGKNKIVDRLCQLLRRPREYIQLHRDTTVNQLMFTTSLEGGILQYTDSPLLRAITYGRVIIIDEADKAPEHVVAIFRSLAGQGELTLSDGRRVRPVRERESDIVVHPNFRLVLLANRPGYPFLGNHFLQVLGENFSAHSVSNPDQASERMLLQQLAPEIDEDTILRLVGAFHDLHHGYDTGVLNYPYSLRELINLVRHMRAYPQDSLGDALRNIFDFDIYKPETIDKLDEILEHHGLQVPHLGLDAAREATKKKIQDIEFEPSKIDLSEPKEGKHDDKEHSGGNTYAGGTGGRDTAGMGGRGGYKRLWKGGDIKQVPEALKDNVPNHIKEKAREMAREELKRRLEELDMSFSEAKAYGSILTATQAHMLSLYNLLEHLAAKEEERVWLKRQTDGELDDTRLTEGLTGEATVYKRRGMEKPELGRPQIKPKRIRFIFDLSGSMYRFQYDGRLQRSMETAVMLMETFERLSKKEKYAWDIYGHSGEAPDIPLVLLDKPPTELRDRCKVVEKMFMIPQYAFAGDYTVEAIEKGVIEVGNYDADDWFVIAITDANFRRYQISPDDLTRVMNRNPKVHTSLICIGESAEAAWITKSLPGRGFRVGNTADIPRVLRSILSTMVDR